MSAKALKWAITAIRRNDMPVNAVLVLLAVARRHRDTPGCSTPTASALSRDTKLDVISVRRALAHLDQIDLVAPVGRVNAAGRRMDDGYWPAPFTTRKPKTPAEKQTVSSGNVVSLDARRNGGRAQ